MADRRPSPIDGLFDRDGHERKVNRILDKAVQKNVRQATRGAGTIGEIKVPKFKKGQGTKSKKNGLASVLAKALSTRLGATSKNKPSLRQSAPDTGGRSFHFEYYSVAKGQAAPPVNGGGTAGSRPGTARAHQRYIEREFAVEAIYAPNELLDMPRKRGRPSRAEIAERADAAKVAETLKNKEREIDGLERSLDRPGLEASPERSALAGQAYIENPTKMMNGELSLSSFGNIAATFEERLKFWELVEEHEPRGDARLQNRLILELPHQSTAEARLEIMKRFVEPLAAKNLPYHVAIHAPGEKNDSRNFHAHIVFSERPASRMKHPETGEDVWDFTVEEAYKTKSRNTKIKHPHRQKRVRDVKDKTFVFDMRKDYARIVTDVMAGVDPKVKFDARSYKDMGLDVMPMRTLNRVLHDRMRDGKLVLDGPGWTKRMKVAELEAAAQRQDPDVKKLLELTKVLENLREAWPNLAKVNKILEPTSRIAGLSGFTKRLFRKTIETRIRLEAEIASERLMAKVDIEVCDRIVKATRPLKVKGVGGREPRTTEEQADLDVINETAREELAAARLRLKTAENIAKIRLKANKGLFQAAGTGLAGALPPKPIAPDEGRQRTRQSMPMAGPAAAAASPTIGQTPIAKAKPDLTGVMFEPGYAEQELKRRKRREVQQRRELAAALVQEQAQTKKRKMEAPKAPEPAKEEDAAELAQRAAAQLALKRAAHAAAISEMMGTMYDRSLTGQAFADSLKPMLDLLYPERNGVHWPDPREEELRALAAETAAKGQELQPGMQANAPPAPDKTPAAAEPSQATIPTEKAANSVASGERQQPAAAPEKPAPAAERKIDLSNLPQPPQQRGELRLPNRNRTAEAARVARQDRTTAPEPVAVPAKPAVSAERLTSAQDTSTKKPTKNKRKHRRRASGESSKKCRQSDASICNDARSHLRQRQRAAHQHQKRNGKPSKRRQQR